MLSELASEMKMCSIAKVTVKRVKIGLCVKGTVKL